MKNKEQLDDLKKLHEIWSQLKPWQRKWLRYQGEVVYLLVTIANVVLRVDLWLFPPTAFFAAYNLAIQNFPDHPIKMIAVLSTAFMFAVLVLMIIRPRRTIHWVKARR